MWYLIVSIPDLCNLITFMMSLSDDKQAHVIDAFNTASIYLDDILKIKKFYFPPWARNYNASLKLRKTYVKS